MKSLDLRLKTLHIFYILCQEYYINWYYEWDEWNLKKIGEEQRKKLEN
jgi:hypothetical protein